MKIENDKYYTPIETANYVWDKVYNVCEDITEVIEPSVGNGSFLQHPIHKVDVAYDILPECTSKDTAIIKGDFLAQDIPYKKGRLVIGNPPYGSRLSKAQKFYKKGVKIADYIAFILPISQLNTSRSMYEFDLVYSEDLGVLGYSGRKLHCCLNIYKRPSKGINPPPKESDFRGYYNP